MITDLEYPDGAEFAFTILDDTDDTTVENGRPVYELLKKAGLRTTKTVWAFKSDADNGKAYLKSETLESPEYLNWVRELAFDGFEIAFHNASMGSSPRDDTIKALDFIEKEIGVAVRLHCNHGQNKENIYWGADRYSSYILNKVIHAVFNYFSYPTFEGHLPESPYYWSDVATARISYMRAFTYGQLNGMRILPGKPFKDPRKKPTPLLFNTIGAVHADAFNQLVNPHSLKKLRKQRGWTIVTTHLGKGFYRNKKLDSEFENTIKFLADQPGCYVPASQLLDLIIEQKGFSEISSLERFRMEYRHVFERIIKRTEKTIKALS